MNFFESIIFLGIRIITLDYFVIKKLIKENVEMGKSVLDLGSGNGYLAPLFPKNGYLGVEIDKELVRLARSSNPGYKFKIGDITKLNLNSKFDLILIIGVIHHLNKRQFENVTKVVKRHMAPKGRSLIIEAIPPISKWNFIGGLLRFFDRGHHVRNVTRYKSELAKKFNVLKAKKVKGGIVDYGFFVITNKKHK